MFASVTRLRVRSLRYVPGFLWMTFLSQRQVVRALEFVGGKLLIDARRTFWTLTAWGSERAMKAFRGSGPHAKVMPKLLEWCDEASYAHWISESDAIRPGRRPMNTCRVRDAYREWHIPRAITKPVNLRGLVSVL